MVTALRVAFLFCLSAGAEEDNQAVKEGYDSFLEAIPDDVAKLLPDGLFSENMDEVHSAVREVTGAGWLFSHIGELLAADVGGAFSLFARLLGILVTVAVLSAVRGSVTDGLARAVGLCGACVITASLLSLTVDTIEAVTAFLERLTVLANGMIPVMGALLAMGGNVGTAVVTNSGMMMVLTVVENLCAATLAPVVGICVAVAVVGMLFGGTDLRGAVNFVKKLYTFFLGLVMTVLTFTLSVQTALAAGADNVAMKSAKLLAGRAIPVVGGSVGETLRTVAGSVGYLKTTVGVAGIVVLALLLLPPLVTVLLYRLGLIAACSCADLLGCSAESRLLDAFVTVFGYLLAVICICSVVVIFLLTLFVKCSVALG